MAHIIWAQFAFLVLVLDINCISCMSLFMIFHVGWASTNIRTDTTHRAPFVLDRDMLATKLRCWERVGTYSTIPRFWVGKSSIHQWFNDSFSDTSWFSFCLFLWCLLWCIRSELSIRFSVGIVGFRIRHNHRLRYFRRSISIFEKCFDLGQRLVRWSSLFSWWLDWCWW